VGRSLGIAGLVVPIVTLLAIGVGVVQDATPQETPKDSQAYINRGLAFYKKGDYGAAFANYNQAIQLDPKYAQAYFDRGLVYYNLAYNKGDKDRVTIDYDLASAIADYTQAIQLDPKYTQAYFNRGLAFYKKVDNEHAIADFTQAIQLDPKYTQPYINRGSSYYYMGDNARAIADYTRAIQLDPKSAQEAGVYKMLAMLQKSQGLSTVAPSPETSPQFASPQQPAPAAQRAQNALPLPPNGTCPHGWTRSDSFCLRSGSGR